MTGTSTPNRPRTAVLIRRADASGSRGRSVTREPDPGPTFEASTPPLAQTKPCGRLGDQDAVRHADDAPRLAQDDLDLARVSVELGREFDGLGTWVDAGEVDDGALRLRDDLLGDDENIVLAERQHARSPFEGVADERPEVVAEADLGDAIERRARRSRRPRSRSGLGRRRGRGRGRQATPSRSGAAASTSSRSSGVSRSSPSGPSSSKIGRAGNGRPLRGAPRANPGRMRTG